MLKKVHAPVAVLGLCLILPLLCLAQANALNRTKPALWRDQGDIGTKNLFYGPGAPERAPREEIGIGDQDLAAGLADRRQVSLLDVAAVPDVVPRDERRAPA
mgnify:CR=1 FL=1